MADYEPSELEATLRRAFVDRRQEAILIDGHELCRRPFIREAFFYGQRKGWLVLKDKLIDPLEIREPGLGQYEGWTYMLSDDGKKYFGLLK